MESVAIVVEHVRSSTLVKYKSPTKLGIPSTACHVTLLVPSFPRALSVPLITMKIISVVFLSRRIIRHPMAALGHPCVLLSPRSCSDWKLKNPAAAQWTE
jgi:hypothetical protein